MKKHIKTYNIHELHQIQKSKNAVPPHLLSKRKKHHLEERCFDPRLTRKIEDLILHPYVNQSLKDFIPSPLISYEQEYNRKIAIAWRTLKEYGEKIQRGMQELRNVGITLGSKTADHMLKPPDDPEIYQKMVEEGKPPQDILSVSDDIMNRSYDEACKHYKNKHYNESANILEVLLYLNPFKSIYWQLHGMAEHLLGNLELAVKDLTIGLQKGSLSLIPYAHLVNCLVDLKHNEEAISVIDTALKIANPTDQHVDAIKQALQKLENDLKGR